MRLRRKDYKIVYADPPWNYYGDPNKNAAAGKHYPLMTQKKLAALPVRQYMDLRSALFMWATGPRLDFAIDIIRAWGLHYRGVVYVWVKTRKDGQIINGQGIPPTFTKPTTEFVLGATTVKRGRPFSIHSMNQPQVVLAPRDRKHSRKPAIIRERIIELCGDLPRVELFATQRVKGWDAWGDGVKQCPTKKIK